MISRILREVSSLENTEMLPVNEYYYDTEMLPVNEYYYGPKG